jgi:hypothetical protein
MNAPLPVQFQRRIVREASYASIADREFIALLAEATVDVRRLHPDYDRLQPVMDAIAGGLVPDMSWCIAARVIRSSRGRCASRFFSRRS